MPVQGVGSSESMVNGIWRLGLRFALIAGLLYGCYRLRNIITTLFVAAIIAYVLDPMVEWLCRQSAFVNAHTGLFTLIARASALLRGLIMRRPVPLSDRVALKRHTVRMFATLYVFVLSVFVLWQGVRLIVAPFVHEIQNLTRSVDVYQDGGTVRKSVLEIKFDEALIKYDETAPEWGKSDRIRKQIRESNITKSVQGLVGEVGQRVLESLKNIVEIVLLPVLAFYFLIDGRKLKHEFVGLVPRRWLRETLRMVNEFNQIMRAFVAGQFILCALAGAVVWFGLAALRVHYSFVLGVLAGITRAIPIVGPIIGGIPIILLSLNQGTGTALAVLGFFTFLHFAESKFVMPLLIGDRMELHPVIIIVVLIAGGEIGGLLIGGSLGALLGMFFAAPVAAIGRVMIRRHWLHLRNGAVRPANHHALPPSEPPSASAGATRNG